MTIGLYDKPKKWSLNDVYILIPGTQSCYVKWQWGIKIVDGIIVANQLIIDWEIILEYPVDPR